MSKLSFGITLSLKSFHATGFESIDFRRRFGLDDSQSTYNCKYEQSRTEIDEGFARAWFGNATWNSAEVDPSWLLPGELVENEKNRDAVQIAPDMFPERAKALYVRARLAEVEGERDRTRAELDTLRSERDELSSTLLLAVNDRNEARFDNEQLKAIVQRLEEQCSAQIRQYNVAEHNELRRRYEQLRREYDAECIRVDQQEARVNRVEAGLQALIKECTKSPCAERSSACSTGARYGSHTHERGPCHDAN